MEVYLRILLLFIIITIPFSLFGNEKGSPPHFEKINFSKNVLFNDDEGQKGKYYPDGSYGNYEDPLPSEKGYKSFNSYFGVTVGTPGIVNATIAFTKYLSFSCSLLSLGEVFVIAIDENRDNLKDLDFMAQININIYFYESRNINLAFTIFGGHVHLGLLAESLTKKSYTYGGLGFQLIARGFFIELGCGYGKEFGQAFFRMDSNFSPLIQAGYIYLIEGGLN